MTTSHIVEIDQLRFSWPDMRGQLLNIPQLRLEAGSSLFLRGPSGSGKSTLLNLVSGVQAGYSGSVSICGERLETLSAHRRDRLRADHIGLIFQQFNLLPWLSPVENVALACRFSRRRRDRAQARSGSVQDEAIRLLRELGLAEVLNSRRNTSALSIGQQQRVAAARALIGSPELIIADEPTSALDSEHRDRFVDLLMKETQANGTSLLFVSHDPALASHFDNTLQLDGITGSSLETRPC
ncbi:methionine ABC transporter ATP-binding protein [Marinobacterium zhoushanense]|uniref:Methionine ABC transporter ATP-binding protein n=1 Tax=Marinobacterium zhoushanense TaxID=1679163 RepID=A0ABQ1KCS4_9GAMM|nr:ABC transporter ATP-binding protein [Marinobacterium zhoushanense]GGB91325.1 methionine ABC transporter ATP-binding protein [Marinobacterium zhoushanense]